jgi:hypothetical protein
MEPDTYAILDSVNELRIGRGRHSRQMTPAGLAAHVEDVAKGQLKATSVAPRSNRVGELERLCAALHSQAGKRVRHEPLAKPRVDWAEHEVGVGCPDHVGGILASERRLTAKRGHADPAAAANAKEWRSNAERDAAEGSGNRIRIFEGSVEPDAAADLGGQANGYCQVR